MKVRLANDGVTTSASGQWTMPAFPCTDPAHSQEPELTTCWHHAPLKPLPRVPLSLSSNT